MKKLAACLMALLLLFPLLCAPVKAAEKTKKVRVGFPIQQGLTEHGENGEYTGYTYEFLQEIAQYTGWEYEFVEIPGHIDDVLGIMLDMLKNGELDILGGIVKNKGTESMFDFPEHSYGTAYSTICVLEENTVINEADFQTFNGARVGVLDNSRDIAGLKSFCTVNNLSIGIVDFEDMPSIVDALKSGYVDALLTMDLSQPDGLRPVAKFSDLPYYFAVTKGNTEIINGLNTTLLQIKTAQPDFPAQLYEKYFDKSRGKLFLTAKERKIISEMPDVRVAVVPTGIPMQYYSADGEFRGLSRKIFDLVTEKAGLRFSFIRTENADTALALLRDGQADAISGIPYDYDFASEHNVLLSAPYFSGQTSLILRRDVTSLGIDDKRRAISGTSLLYSEDSKRGENLHYPSLSAAMDAIDRGKADYAYSNSYSAEYYFEKGHYQDVLLLPDNLKSVKFCIGLRRPVNKIMLSAINKTIRSISEDELQQLLFQSTTELEHEVTLKEYIYANPWQSVIVVVLFAILLLSALFWVFHIRLRSGKRVALAHQRYMQLSEISNEYLFDYDCLRDSMTLSKRFSDEFNLLQIVDHCTQQGAHAGSDTAYNHFLKFFSQFSNLINNGDFLCDMPDGSSHWFRVVATTVYDARGKKISVIGKFQDIQKEKEESERLLEISKKDGLTQLYNSAACRCLISEELSRIAEGEKAALLVMDVDRFKTVNDTFGHYTGDIVLQNIAQLLQRQFPSSCIVGRLGGDEFAVFIESVQDEQTLSSSCAALCNGAKEITCGDDKYTVTLSIGAVLTDGRTAFEDLYMKADGALYAAKDNGRDQFEIIT